MTDEIYYPENDATGGLTEEEQQRVQPFLESLGSIDLEEMTISTVRIGIRDVRTTKDAEGIPHRKADPRIAEIENFVPMRVFNRMLASRNRVMQQRTKYLSTKKNDADGEEDVDPMVQWMLTQILEVWKLTPGEEDMTLERLENGLDFPKIYKLFTVFFDKMMKQMGGQAPLVHSNHL